MKKFLILLAIYALLLGFSVLSVAQAKEEVEIISAISSSVQPPDEIKGETYEAKNAIDRNDTTRWASGWEDNEWIMFDLGSPSRIASMELKWEAAYAKAYKIEISKDKHTWTEVYSTSSGDSGVDKINFLLSSYIAQYVKLSCTQRGTEWGYSLWEAKIFKE